MMTAMTSRLQIDPGAIADFCRRRNITELSLFGSVLRDDFGADSDVDVLVTFGPDDRSSLFDFVAMQDELAGIVGRDVDLVDELPSRRARTGSASAPSLKAPSGSHAA